MEINPKWKIIDEFEHKGIVPEKLKSLTLGKLFSELNNIPTKISRINRLLKKAKAEKVANYKLQKEVHEKEQADLLGVFGEIKHVSVEMIKELV